MWVKPWNMKEGFLIGGGLLFTGILLQVAMGPIRWGLFAWPVNLIVLVLLLAAVGVLFALRRKVYAFDWMMHAGAAVPCLVYAVALTILMGLLPQVREGGMPWLSQMLRFWPFVLIWTWDPKETWAAATWLCYLVYLHLRKARPGKWQSACMILLVSFVCLQICWWGINYLPSAQGLSIHTYNAR